MDATPGAVEPQPKRKRTRAKKPQTEGDKPQTRKKASKSKGPVVYIASLVAVVLLYFVLVPAIRHHMAGARANNDPEGTPSVIVDPDLQEKVLEAFGDQHAAAMEYAAYYSALAKKVAADKTMVSEKVNTKVQTLRDLPDVQDFHPIIESRMMTVKDLPAEGPLTADQVDRLVKVWTEMSSACLRAAE